MFVLFSENKKLKTSNINEVLKFLKNNDNLTKASYNFNSLSIDELIWIIYRLTNNLQLNIDLTKKFIKP